MSLEQFQLGKFFGEVRLSCSNFFTVDQRQPGQIQDDVDQSQLIVGEVVGAPESLDAHPMNVDHHLVAGEFIEPATHQFNIGRVLQIEGLHFVPATGDRVIYQTAVVKCKPGTICGVDSTVQTFDGPSTLAATPLHHVGQIVAAKVKAVGTGFEQEFLVAVEGPWSDASTENGGKMRESENPFLCIGNTKKTIGMMTWCSPAQHDMTNSPGMIAFTGLIFIRRLRRGGLQTIVGNRRAHHATCQ